METKAFFLDMDGTLLNNQKEITLENRTAIQSALTMGHRIIISSGRTLNSIAALAKRLNLDNPGCYWIACNGAAIYDCGQKRVLLRRNLPMISMFIRNLGAAIPQGVERPRFSLFLAKSFCVCSKKFSKLPNIPAV